MSTNQMTTCDATKGELAELAEMNRVSRDLLNVLGKLKKGKLIELQASSISQKIATFSQNLEQRES